MNVTSSPPPEGGGSPRGGFIICASLEKPAGYLRRCHPEYGVGDVVLTSTPGILHCAKPCPRRSWLCTGEERCHTISIVGVGHPPRDERGRFVFPYKLWRELHGLLPEE